MKTSSGSMTWILEGGVSESLDDRGGHRGRGRQIEAAVIPKVDLIGALSFPCSELRCR